MRTSLDGWLGSSMSWRVPGHGTRSADEDGMLALTMTIARLVVSRLGGPANDFHNTVSATFALVF